MPVALIVLEDTKLQDKFRNALYDAGFDCVVVSSRDEARKHIMETPIDFVIVPDVISGKDGIAFSQEVRATKGAGYLPVVVVVSEAPSDELISRAMDGGVDYVLEQSVSAQVLKSVAEARFRVKQTHDWLAREVEKDYEEFEMARKVQEKLLPSKYPDNDRLRFAARYVPTDQVGGDFYDIITHENDSIGLFISDVSGHGVHAAFTTMSIKTALNTWARGVVSPSETFILINNLVLGIVSVGRFVTAFYCKIDLDTLKMVYSNAGHPPALLFRKGSKTPELLDTESGFPLGITPDSVYIEKTVTLAPGDKLFLYTDGVDEARSPEDELFGEERLFGCISRNLDKEVDDILEILLDEVKAFAAGRAFYDDINLLAVEVIK